MKRFTHSRVLDAPPDSVIELITTEAHLRRRYESDALLAFELEILRDDDERFESRLRREFDPGNRIPRPARRLVGESISVVQENAWARVGPPYHGSSHVTVPGVSGHISADLRLEPDTGGKTRMTADGRVEVRVPVIGGQIERMLLGLARDSFVDSTEAINEAVGRD